MGPKLKESRINLSLSIEEVSEKLKIRKQYLIAMEEGRWEDIPGKVYREGYLKMYCKFMDIPFDDAIDSSSNNSNKEKSKDNSPENVKLVLLLILALTISFSYLIYNRLNQASNISQHLEDIDHKNYLTESNDIKLK